MSVPGKTVDKIGPSTMQRVRRFDSDHYYALTGNDLNDLAVLVERFSYSFDDANENRDWQNRLSLMISKVEKLT